MTFKVLLTNGQIVPIEADTLGVEGEDIFVFYRKGVLGRREVARYSKLINLQNIALPGFTFKAMSGRFVAVPEE